MSDNKIQFSFKETEPNMNSFSNRAIHMFGVANPLNFFVPDEEIIAKVATVKRFKELAKNAEGGKIMISSAEKAEIMRGIELMNSCTNDVGDLVPKPFRMCGFMPINVPIICGMMLSSPTIFNTVFF